MALNYDWVYALVGFLVMFGLLSVIGINKPRGMSVKTWCFGYLAVALGFDVFVVLGLVGQFPWLSNLLLGLSGGAATGLALHVMHHINDENEHPTIMG
ncbi:MAG TPA: hypothetical protein VK253_01450 [Candidatus Binatia bacterium]|nr:hypothetical protein [Candidatus Binatia bacterium]